MDTVAELSVNELAIFLTNELEGKVDHPEPIVSIFKDQKITGLVFLTLTTEQLESLVPILGERKAIINLINSLKVKRNEETVTKVNLYLYRLKELSIINIHVLANIDF